MKLLLVEDLDELRSVLERSLSAQGYEVLAARTAEEALALAYQQGSPVDLLLTDWSLPAMNGDDLARALVSRNPRLKVLFSSGEHPEEGLEWLQGLGEFLAKPYDIEDLLAALRRLAPH